MFERFTDQARRVVVLAQDESRILNHNYIGTEHLLLGMLREGKGGAATALEAMGIGLEAVRQQVEEIVGRGKEIPSGHIPFTPRAKKVLEFSLRESLQLGHDYIGSEHILLGLIREGEGLAAQILVQLGADLPRVREQVLRQLADQPAEQREEERSSVRTGGSSGVLEGIVSRLDAIAERLTAIERHLGIGGQSSPPPGESSAEPPAKPPAEPSAERPAEPPAEPPAA
jgi:ATP-dependent Clp protease ATP-binding subunit ClpC